MTRLSAVEIARRIDDGRLTAESLATALHERIASREAAVHAWAHLDRELVLRQARAVDASPRRGVLSGVPLGIKDIMDTADQPTCYGSPIYEGHRPRADAGIVALLRAAGGVIMGKTVTTEFAYRHPNATRNPRNLAHTPGGSSSGSAAAVADFHVPLATGTQTAGSIIRPAAYCGIVGFKPTFGEIPAVGVKACAWSLDTMGFMARAVADIGLVRAAFTGSPARPFADQGAPVVGVCRTPSWPMAEPPVHALIETAARVLTSAGANVKETELPPACGTLLEAQRLIMFFEMARSLAGEASRHGEQLSATLVEKLTEGNRTTFDQYRTAHQTAERCRFEVDGLLSGVDILLTPAAVGEAPRGLTSTGEPVFNGIWTVLHTPCITLPAGKGPAAGLPLGIQLVGARRKDEALLHWAAWVEKALAAAGLAA